MKIIIRELAEDERIVALRNFLLERNK